MGVLSSCRPHPIPTFTSKEIISANGIRWGFVLIEVDPNSDNMIIQSLDNDFGIEQAIWILMTPDMVTELRQKYWEYRECCEQCKSTNGITIAHQ